MVNFICGVILLLFIAGVMIAAAIAVGWLMVFGMMIVFVLEAYRRIRRSG